MIMTVDELRQYVDTDKSDQVLEAMLQALELSVRAYTNNNFMARAFRVIADVQGDKNRLIVHGYAPFTVGDTLQITDAEYMQDALVTVKAIRDNEIEVNEPLFSDPAVVLTKVVYPADVKMGVANLCKWELERRDKVGVSSETISRHSVTYFDMSGDNAVMGFPKALTGFLQPYMKARFGRGIKV